MAPYFPELGQVAFGNPTSRYALPEYVSALFNRLIDFLEIAYWNRMGEQWYDHDAVSLPGVVYCPYYWGHEDDSLASRPNFTFEEVEIRFYKHPGRGESTNVDWEPAQWAAWYTRAKEAIQSWGMGAMNGEG